MDIRRRRIRTLKTKVRWVYHINTDYVKSLLGSNIMKGLNILIYFFYLVLLLSQSIGTAGTKFELSIPRMTCPSCTESITKSLEKIAPISDVVVKNLKFSFKPKPEDEKLFTDVSIVENIKNAGYNVIEVKRIMELNEKLNNNKK